MRPNRLGGRAQYWTKLENMEAGLKQIVPSEMYWYVNAFFIQILDPLCVSLQALLFWVRYKTNFARWGWGAQYKEIILIIILKN